MSKCIFCEIVAGKIPTNFVYQDHQIAVFHDINPKAKVHLLFIPKLHIPSLIEINTEHADLIFHLTTMLPKVAKEQGLANGFRVAINTGRDGGQIIDHLHYHLLGGNDLEF